MDVNIRNGVIDIHIFWLSCTSIWNIIKKINFNICRFLRSSLLMIHCSYLGKSRNLLSKQFLASEGKLFHLYGGKWNLPMEFLTSYTAHWSFDMEAVFIQVPKRIMCLAWTKAQKYIILYNALSILSLDWFSSKK